MQKKPCEAKYKDAADAYIEDMEETDKKVLERGIEVIDSFPVVTR